MSQRSGVEHWVVSVLGLELSEDQDPSCISVNWEQNLIGGHLMQQRLLSSLIIITFQQLYCTA